MRSHRRLLLLDNGANVKQPVASEREGNIIRENSNYSRSSIQARLQDKLPDTI